MTTELQLAKTLADLRKKKGISQRLLAERVGLDRTYISLIELGRRNPTVKVLITLGDALDVKPSKILAMIGK